MTSRRRRSILGGLLAAHLAAGVTSALAVRGGSSWPAINVIVFLTLFLADASLIGFWAGFSMRSLRARLAIVAVGWGYLMLLPIFTEHGYGPDLLMFALLVSLSMLPGFVVAAAMRFFRPQLRLALQPEGERGQLQVSIRFMFAFTAAVAVLLMFFQLVQTHAKDAEVIAGLMLPLSYGWICCVVALAILAPRKIVASALAAVAVCPLAGAIPAHYLGSVAPELRDPYPWAAMAGADAAIIAATLLVVRWCGYRLVGRETLVAAAASGADDNVTSAGSGEASAASTLGSTSFET